jgi:hypothetical protein
MPGAEGREGLVQGTAVGAQEADTQPLGEGTDFDQGLPEPVEGGPGALQ